MDNLEPSNEDDIGHEDHSTTDDDLPSPNTDFDDYNSPDPLADYDYEISLSQQDSDSELYELNIADDFAKEEFPQTTEISDDTTVDEYSHPATGANLDYVIAAEQAGQYQDELESLASLFTQGQSPTPQDGLPWIDNELIGSTQPFTTVGNMDEFSELDNSEQLQAALSGLENNEDSPPEQPLSWSELASSTDPSIQALAKLWGPEPI